jgi:hypothetical protein
MLCVMLPRESLIGVLKSFPQMLLYRKADLIAIFLAPGSLFAERSFFFINFYV